MLPKIKKLVFEVEFQQTESPYQGRSGDAFLTKFSELRQTLLANLQEFIPVDVVPRPPPPHFILASGRFNRHTYLDSKKNKLVQFPRKNSFEIYVDNFHLFSRLQSGTWPDVSAICEWALRVAEKFVDMQIQKEEGPLKEHLQQMGKEAIINGGVAQDKLPPVSKAFDQTVKNRAEKSRHSNYPRSRYSSLREDDGLMPYGVDPMNSTAIQKRSYFNRSIKFKAKSIDREQKTISKDFYTGSRDQSFHWHIKQKSIKPLFSGKYHEVPVNSFEGVTKLPNIQLSPLPAVHEKNILDQTQEIISQVKIDTVELKLSESPLNIYRKYYRIQANKIVKTSGDEIWSPILCQTPLPLIGEYSFQIFINSSVQNQVQIGIAPLSYYPQTDQAQKPDSLVSFNCGNGRIKDAKHNNFAAETQWRQGGIKVTQKPPFCLKAAVNTKTKIIDWHVNDTIVASAKLTSQYNTGFRAFLSLYHTLDIVSLNQIVAGQNFTSFDTIEPERRKQPITVNASAQTGVPSEAKDAADAVKPIPTSQNKIYPNLKIKQAMPMVDEVTQTTQIIEGRIRKQRFHRFLQKSEPEKVEFEKRKDDFSIEDIKTYKTIFAGETSNISREWSVNAQNYQRPEPKPAAIDMVIIQQQVNEIKGEVHTLLEPQSQELFSKNIQLEKQQISQQESKQALKLSPAAPIIQESSIIVKPSINQQLVIQHQYSSKKEQYLNNQQQLRPQIIEHPLLVPIEQKNGPETSELIPIIESQPQTCVQDEQKEISEAGEAARWEGVYEQGAFKLKTVHIT